MGHDTDQRLAPQDRDARDIVLQHRPCDGRTPTETWCARVAVRIPRNDGTDLLANATRRLEQPAPVEPVDVVEMCGIEPALSATIVRLDVRLTAREDVDETQLETRLEEAPGAEEIATLERE